MKHQRKEREKSFIYEQFLTDGEKKDKEKGKNEEQEKERNFYLFLGGDGRHGFNLS